MGMNGDQMFVASEDIEQISNVIRDYVKRVGAAAFPRLNEKKPDPILERRTERTFILSTPENGYVTVWEDGANADLRLAAELSAALQTEVVNLMMSSTTDSWAYARYKDGKQVAAESKSSSRFFEQAQKFVEKNRLPFAFVYFHDPNVSSMVDEVLAEMRGAKKEEPKKAAPQIEVRTLPKDVAEAAVKQFEHGKRASKEMRAKVEHFTELILPTKPSKSARSKTGGSRP